MKRSVSIRYRENCGIDRRKRGIGAQAEQFLNEQGKADGEVPQTERRMSRRRKSSTLVDLQFGDLDLDLFFKEKS